MDAIATLDRLRAARNVLEHPFYRRWSAGRLSPHELSVYAGEYRHAVVALAEASALAERAAPAADHDALRLHAEEEAGHVGLWERFATAAGASSGSAPLALTRECARSWIAGEDSLEHLAVLYAIEAGQPEISRTKLDGLVEHYGYHPEGHALEYFRVHTVRDHDHARDASELITRGIRDARDPASLLERMASRARAALRGNWLLLDGVEAHAAALTG
jgi:pyrroloquinoline-quinone synthase